MHSCECRLVVEFAMFRDVDGRGDRGADGGRRRHAAGSPRPGGHLPPAAAAARGRLRPQPAPEHRRVGPRRRSADGGAASRRPSMVPEQAGERSTSRKTKSVAVIRRHAGISHCLLTYLLTAWKYHCLRSEIVLFFRSTPPSRPNKVGLQCPSVGPQNVSSISVKFGTYVEVDE